MVVLRLAQMSWIRIPALPLTSKNSSSLCHPYEPQSPLLSFFFF